jgi:hypoxanthine-DNA glycosylase
MARVVNSLKAIIDQNSQVLILGTMPGPESLEKEEYYANPKNQFWKIIYCIINGRYEPPSDYKKRIKFLKQNGIALWDVLESCERQGASDSKITYDKPNDFEDALLKHPNLKCIFFNGKKAEQSFKKYGCPKGMETKKLPSSSSANTRMTLDEKVGCWRVIKDFL